MIKALFILVAVGGCDLYWNHGGDDVCNGAGAAIYPAQEVRDPQTGQCQASGGGGGCGPCGPCIASPPSLEPDWATCSGKCEALDEQACLPTAGCHAGYRDVGGQSPTFWGCWEVPPSGAVEGACQNLDAQTCSEHDDCISIYSGNTPTSNFESCAPEPANSCTTVLCASGAHCEDQCVPCNSVGCTSTCQPKCVPDATCAGVTCDAGSTCAIECTGAPATCAAQCVPTNHDPGVCYGTVTCNSAPPACPSSTTPGVANGCYTGYCIPVTNCGPFDPGSCFGTRTCTTAAPACPTGTMPGVANGCWTGYCIPDGNCEVPACSALTTEASCTARADCQPVYSGTDCTCYPDHCDCKVLTFEACQVAGLL